MQDYRNIMRKSGWVTPQEAADLAGVHVATIYRLCDDDQIEETRHGRFRYISRESLAEYYSAPPIARRIREAELPPIG